MYDLLTYLLKQRHQQHKLNVAGLNSQEQEMTDHKITIILGLKTQDQKID